MLLSDVNVSEPPRRSPEVKARQTTGGVEVGGFPFWGVAFLLVLIVGCLGPVSSLTLAPTEQDQSTYGFLLSSDMETELNGEDLGFADSLRGPSPTSARAQASVPLLGELEPTTCLLPSGTVSVTLVLTTTAPAHCRWSEQPDTLYDAMPFDFEQGQGTTIHGTQVSGFHDLDERWFYVRCQDLTTARNPDGDEQKTHLRVLGPWDGGYPRIANLYGEFGLDLLQVIAGHDIFIPYRLDDPATQASAIRAVNPNAKVLRLQYATKGRPEDDSLTAEWWNSEPDDPGFNCLLRDTNREILISEGWGHPVYNLTQSYCREALVQKNVADFLSSESDLGADLAYDGIYWDTLVDRVSWLGSDIDSDLDGHPDNPEVLDAAYQTGVEELLAQVRARLPHVLLLGNGSPVEYGSWLNGRIYETGLPSLLDGAEGQIWDTMIVSYRDWVHRSQPPHVTILFSAPRPIYRAKHNSEFDPHILPAFEAEAAASYRRMRFGLTSALMGNGLFLYDLGEVDRPLAWYDEFGVPGSDWASSLPPDGYLGQPIGRPYHLVDRLDTLDQILNGDFEDGLEDWSFWVDTSVGAAATADIDPRGGISGSAAAHFTISSVAQPWDVKLSQYNRTTIAGENYTLSFWARSDVTRTVEAEIDKQDPPGTHYGFRVQAVVTPEWQHFHLWDNLSVTASDGQLKLEVGEQTGELWLDEVQLQVGALGVWARPFEHGLAVINTTREVQTASLPGVLCKLHGNQAPLFQVRVDDDEARSSAGWSGEDANREQFGGTIHQAPGGSGATITYSPVLAYGGEYEVLAWVAPSTTQSSAVSVTIRHAQGGTVMFLDETTGEVGWHSLGTYPFSAGEHGSAMVSATGSGAVVADAFKWVSTARYNDGTEVSQLTLQPQDGIILLSSCYQGEWQYYLPLVTRHSFSVQGRDLW